jgi:hypothetical protein
LRLAVRGLTMHGRLSNVVQPRNADEKSVGRVAYQSFAHLQREVHVPPHPIKPRDWEETSKTERDDLNARTGNTFVSKELSFSPLSPNHDHVFPLLMFIQRQKQWISLNISLRPDHLELTCTPAGRF